MQKQHGDKRAMRLPPTDDRVFEGEMSRTILTASNRKKVQVRHAVLTDDRLLFSKSHLDQDMTTTTSLKNDVDISTEELWNIFEKVDVDKDG